MFKILFVVLILSVLSSCSNTDPSEVSSTIGADVTSVTTPTTTTPATLAPGTWHRIPDKITIEFLEEMNHGQLPEIEYHDDGRVRNIEREIPTKRISPFPVFNEEEAWDLMGLYADLLDITENLDIRFEEIRERSETTHFRFAQYYNGLKISGNMVGIGLTTDSETGAVHAVGSSHLSNLNIETTPKISLVEAKQIIVSEYDDVGIYEQREHELYIFYDGGSSENVPELVWKINTTGEIMTVTMSAITGEIIFDEGAYARAGVVTVKGNGFTVSE